MLEGCSVETNGVYVSLIIGEKAAEMAAMDGILGLGERFQRNCDDIINIIKELQAPSEDIAKYVGAMANTMLELQQGTGEKI